MNCCRCFQNAKVVKSRAKGAKRLFFWGGGVTGVLGPHLPSQPPLQRKQRQRGRPAAPECGSRDPAPGHAACSQTLVPVLKEIQSASPARREPDSGRLPPGLAPHDSARRDPERPPDTPLTSHARASLASPGSGHACASGPGGSGFGRGGGVWARVPAGSGCSTRIG